jgi:flagellin
MSLSLTTNVSALVAQRNLAANSSAASKSIARLSSGSRLSSVADDSTAFAIGNKLRSGIAGLEQASLNASQGASLIQVATGGLERTVDILTRLKTLSTQVVNGTLGATERAFAQQEFGQLLEQVDSISQQTRFNGVSLLNGGTGKTVVANNGKNATGLSSVNNGFTAAIDTAASSGFVSATFSGPNSVNVSVEKGQVNLDINGEIFTASSAVSAGTSFVLTSTSDANNKIAFRLNATDVTAIDTDGELESSLATLLGNATLKVGVSEEISGLTTNASFTTQAINLSRTGGAFGGTVSSVTVLGGASAGDYTVELNIGTEKFRASSVSPTPNGVLELVSTENDGNVLTLDFSNSVSAISTAATFSTELNNLFQTGGTAAVVTVGDSEAAFGLNAVTNAFAGTINKQNTKGFIDGVAQNVSVTKSGNAFDIEVKIGNQTFATKGFSASANGTLNLTSTSDNNNVISFDLAGTVSSLSTLDETTASLKQLLGLDAGQTVGPARFQSASASLDGFNGIEAGSDQSIKAGAGTPPGTYALSYNADSQEFKLTDGVKTFTKKLSQSGDQTVSFDNGISVKLGSPGNSFNANQSLAQTVFKVGEGDNVKLDFQISDIAGDDIKIRLASTTVKALGLEGANITTIDGARDAGQKIDTALNNINTVAAGLGAQQSRFEFVQANIATQVENLKAARSTFTSVNVASESTALAQSQAQVQAAISQLAQANQLPQQLLRLLG